MFEFDEDRYNYGDDYDSFLFEPIEEKKNEESQTKSKTMQENETLMSVWEAYEHEMNESVEEEFGL